MTRNLSTVVLVVTALFGGSHAHANPEPVAVVVPKGSPISAVSLSQLKSVFLGKTQVIDGQSVIPLNLATANQARVLFDAKVLGMAEKEVARHWVHERIRGGRQPLKELRTADLVAKVVAKLNAAIAYLPVSAVTDDIKVVAVDGKKPGDGAYPIK